MLIHPLSSVSILHHNMGNKENQVSIAPSREKFARMARNTILQAESECLPLMSWILRTAESRAEQRDSLLQSRLQLHSILRYPPATRLRIFIPVLGQKYTFWERRQGGTSSKGDAALTSSIDWMTCTLKRR